MIFYSEEKGHHSHMIRIVLAEKDIAKVNNQNIIFGLVSNNKLLNQLYANLI